MHCLLVERNFLTPHVRGQLLLNSLNPCSIKNVTFQEYLKLENHVDDFEIIFAYFNDHMHG